MSIVWQNSLPSISFESLLFFSHLALHGHYFVDNTANILVQSHCLHGYKPIIHWNFCSNIVGIRGFCTKHIQAFCRTPGK
ncbi:hypothetical protein BLA29_001523 [Euroglyphus maynei]|uniref:Uncharacterized protein n=1 Tax=Euroglyphus maynei TaxID=6958 RepID=A0A1Y3B6R7_EURMA|nr:hypothetical protein BLA29_001523 [Euroglyphus maynei]